MNTQNIRYIAFKKDNLKNRPRTSEQRPSRHTSSAVSSTKPSCVNVCTSKPSCVVKVVAGGGALAEISSSLPMSFHKGILGAASLQTSQDTNAMRTFDAQKMRRKKLYNPKSKEFITFFPVRSAALRSCILREGKPNYFTF